MGFEGYDLGETLARSPRTHLRRAVRRSDGRAVIVKSLVAEYPTPREVGQLEFEYRILGRLDAPTIVRALDLVAAGHRTALILDDCGGADLSSLLSGPMPLDLFFEIAIPVVRALGYIHARNVIHKDVKPQNIVFNPASRAVNLIDFSIASELSLASQEILPVSQLEGSLPYMSPEQTGRMNRDLDYRSDHYSLGVTFFELLTGALPFAATDPLGWIHCHVSKPAPGVDSARPACPKPLAAIVSKLMAKNPDDRYQSARGLLKDLERCQRAWAEGRAIPDFEIGTHDVSERFQLSRTLFGRERESGLLLDAFEDARRGRARLLLVTGPSGVGKSSLIQDLRRAVAGSGGRFISGKFDQLGREVPYAALGQALRELVKELLAEPDDRLRAWRETLAAALGSSGQMLLELIPELEQVVGPQPRLTEMNAGETQNRFHRVFRDFIGAVAGPRHPLVIFIDDLQWTDPSTPDLLAHLLGDGKLQHLLIIGAYRQKEVGAGHPLLAAVDTLQAIRPEAAQRIVLAPLSVDGVNRVVAATLHRDPLATQPLGALIFQKTAGNPFFVNELLGLFHREGAFQLVADEGGWAWDHDKIERAASHDSVVELMVQKLKLLPAMTVEYLCFAACIGNRFELRTLARLADRSAGSVAAALREAVEAQVLVPLGGGYRLVRDDGDYDDAALDDLGVRYQFRHDRVQEAAYAQLAPPDRARVHLALGRTLLAGMGQGEPEQEIFDLVNHLNLGRALMATPDERAQLARLNETAGQAAKRSAAYAIAAAYLEVRLELTPTEEGAAASARTFECRRVFVECVYLAGGVERAGGLCDALIADAAEPLAGAAVLTLKALILSHQGRLFESVDAIRAGLSLLGVDLPADHGEIDRRVGEGIGKMQRHLAERRIEDFVHLPEMTDEVQIVIMNLLYQVVPSAIQSHPPLFVLAELMMFDLALTQGTTAVSCKNFVDCGIIQAGILGDFEGAYRLGKVAFALLDRYAPTRLAAAVNFVFANFVSHWRAPYREGLQAFARAQRIGVETGDVLHAGYAAALEVHRYLSVGTPLSVCQTKAERAAAYLKQNDSVMQLIAVRVVERALIQLWRDGIAAPTTRPDDDFTREIVGSRNPQWIFLHGQLQAMVSFLLGDTEGAVAWGAFIEPYVQSCGTQFSMPDHVLFQGLVLAERFASASASERRDLLTTLGAKRDQLKTWAENSPDNFAHKYLLLCAEIARCDGAPVEETIGLYDRALSAAGEGFIHFRALINERQAELWLGKQQPRIARAFLQEAYYLYERWGAHRKLRHLERRHPDWLGRAPDDGSIARFTASGDTGRGASLDLTSVIKATQAISSEVRPDKLFAKLMSAIIENAGAQRGCLILKADASDELTVGARASVEPDPRDAARSSAIEDCDDLCPRIVRYVARTREAVVIDDARQHPAYQDDPYVQRNGVKSVLSLPVLNQGKLLAILYAENNAVTHAFTPERLTLLQVIASQAAISISNAGLYGSLEDRVKERTVELSLANETLATQMRVREKMEAELRQGQKLEAVGRLASGVAHEINTPIQFVNDSLHFVRDAMADLTVLIEKYRNVNQSVLQSAADDAPWMALAREVSEAEAQADLKYLLDNIPAALARSLDGLDRVATIVRSMKEFAHPDKLHKTTIDLNQAIASTLTIARHEYKYVADVETDFGVLPPVSCHAGEVNQAILNLIVNAAHAIAEVVKGTERRGRIKIATRYESGTVVVSLSDTGGGIPEHVRDKIFDPFFTTKEVGKGTGQGLFIARSVITEKHGGTLTFETETGKGTTFMVRLPIAGGPEADGAGAQGSGQAGDQAGGHSGAARDAA